jgi:hypothetical protein
MEGASYIANKGVQESHKFVQKLYNLADEYDRRANMCVTDPTIKEINGNQFFELKDWIELCLTKEGQDIQARFDSLLENVNYHLSEANKVLGK